MSPHQFKPEATNSVASFVNDGFTDEQAREIVTAMFRTYGRETE